MANKPLKLNKRHLLAISMTIEGRSGEAITKACKISIPTLHTWKNWPMFMQELEKQREESIANSRMVLRGVAEKASFALAGLLDCYIPSVKFKAAKEILDRIYGSPTSMQQVTTEIKGELKLDTDPMFDNGTKELLRQLHLKLNIPEE